MRCAGTTVTGPIPGARRNGRSPGFDVNARLACVDLGIALASTFAWATTFGLVAALTAVFTGRNERGRGTAAFASAVFRGGSKAELAAVAQSVKDQEEGLMMGES